MNQRVSSQLYYFLVLATPLGTSLFVFASVVIIKNMLPALMVTDKNAILSALFIFAITFISIVYTIQLFKLAHYVEDLEDSLLIKKRQLTETVALKDIKYLKPGPHKTITLQFKTPNKFGRSVTFMPESGLVNNKIFSNLQQRIYETHTSNKRNK